MFVIESVKRSKTVKYRQKDSDGDTVVTWMIERPGDYAPGWEHLRYRVTDILTVGFSLIDKGDGWVVKGVVIEVAPADGEPGTIVTTVDPEGAMPGWLTDLADRARAED